ncbi:MAG: hypothetical protein HEQ39_08155 [Rhizobacter sp.]
MQSIPNFNYGEEVGRTDQANWPLYQKVKEVFGKVTPGTVGAYLLAMVDVKPESSLDRARRGQDSRVLLTPK